MEKGKIQAGMAHALWDSELEFAVPLPEKLYCSPLTRALRTHMITFDGINFEGKPKTMILEVQMFRYRQYIQAITRK
jgi:hypothetical protein